MASASFTGWQQYLGKLCNSHYLVKHGKLIDITLPHNYNNVRHSFFRMNQFVELLAAEQSSIHYPCVVHERYSGYIKDPSYSGFPTNDVISVLLFLDKPEDAASGNNNLNALEAAQQRSADVMNDFIDKMFQDYLADEICGPINFDLNNIAYTPIDKEFQNVTGWRCSFRFDTKKEPFNAARWLDNTFEFAT